MRKELSKINNVRTLFFATVSRFGTKKNWNGFPEPTIMFSDIKTADGKKVTDHIWFTVGKRIDRQNLCVGDNVSFNARVKPYTKGYVNYREGINDRRKDYRLSNITNIQKIKKTEELFSAGGEINEPFQELINAAKNYKTPIDADLINSKSKKGHTLDNLPKNTEFIIIDSSLFEKEKKAFGKVSKYKIAFHDRPSVDLQYWEKKIDNGAKPPVLIEYNFEGENQLRVRDGNNRLNVYLNKNIKDIPAVLTINAKQFLENKDKAFSAGGKLPTDKPITDNRLLITEKIANLRKTLPLFKGKEKKEMEDYIKNLEMRAATDISKKYPKPADIPQQAWDYLIKKFTSYEWKWYVDDGIKKYIKRLTELKDLLKNKDFKYFKKKDVLSELERNKEFLDNPVYHNAVNYYEYIHFRKQHDDNNLGEWIIMTYKLSDIDKKHKNIIEFAQQADTEDDFVRDVRDNNVINDLYNVFPEEKITGGWLSAARIIYKFAKYSEGKFAVGGDVASILNISETKAKNIYHLPLEISVYVPSTKGVDEKISNAEFEKRITEVQKYLADMCGGFSADAIEGGYMSTKRELIKEGIVKVVSFCTKENYKKNKNQLLNKISEWSRLWTQEAIGFEFEGDMMYVPQKLSNGGSLITDNRLQLTEKIEKLRKTLPLLEGQEYEDLKKYIADLELSQKESEPTADYRLPITDNLITDTSVTDLPITNNPTPNSPLMTPDYYIAIGDKQHGFLRFEPILGTPVKFKGLEGYDIFAYKDNAAKWYCTYGLTGHLIPSDLFFFDPFNYPKPTKSDFGFQSIEDMQLFYDSLNPEYLAKLTNSLNSAVAMSVLSPRKEIRQMGRGGYITNRTIKINHIGKNYHRKTHGERQQMLLDIHA